MSNYIDHLLMCETSNKNTAHNKHTHTQSRVSFGKQLPVCTLMQRINLFHICAN